jgi:hypothetical protein
MQETVAKLRDAGLKPDEIRRMSEAALSGGAPEQSSSRKRRA